MFNEFSRLAHIFFSIGLEWGMGGCVYLRFGVFKDKWNINFRYIALVFAFEIMLRIRLNFETLHLEIV